MAGAKQKRRANNPSRATRVKNDAERRAWRETHRMAWLATLIPVSATAFYTTMEYRSSGHWHIHPSLLATDLAMIPIAIAITIARYRHH